MLKSHESQYYKGPQKKMPILLRTSKEGITQKSKKMKLEGLQKDKQTCNLEINIQLIQSPT